MIRLYRTRKSRVSVVSSLVGMQGNQMPKGVKPAAACRDS